MASKLESGQTKDLANRIILGSRGDLSSTSIPTSTLVPLTKESDSAVLSFAQERLWFLDQINHCEVSANISRALRIRGELRLELLKQSLQAVVDRHESLRTTFATRQLQAGVDSKPAQLIARNSKIEIGLRDISHDPEN